MRFFYEIFGILEKVLYLLLSYKYLYDNKTINMEKKYERLCPACGKKLKYGSNTAWNLAKRRNSKCRNCSTKIYAKRIGDASFLLEDTNESFYWVGFILADGSFNENRRLTVILSSKDKLHLEKLSKRLGVSYKNTISIYNGKEYNQVKLSIMHTDIFNSLTTKFDIKRDKTHIPPNVLMYDNFNREQLLSLFIGFIDGDGSIGKKHNRNDFNIRIKCHSNWLPFLKYFTKKLNINSTIKINNQGYCLFEISNYTICKTIKNEVLELNIPYLKRKWDVIDLTYFGKKFGNSK